MDINSFIFLVIAVFATSAIEEDGPQIDVRQGSLRGKYLFSSKQRKFSAFTAIPYGRPPVGQLRFKPPKPAKAWKGIFDATKDHPVCIQLFLPTGDVVGEEDCLYLNVYTPEIFDSEEVPNFPVMIFIHGGGFFMGSANEYGPNILLNKDVVLVTINYRLGPFGFLTSGTMDALGNYGLKDQAMAIKWVKTNIKKFGGDPDRIVVFGQSAGGASAHYHMLSPLSKDLISGVIAQSGTAIANWALMPHFLNTRYSKILSGQMGCDTYNVEQMMICIRKQDAGDILKNMSIFKEWYIEPMLVFKPVIEPDFPTSFLAEDPIDIIKSGKAAKVPFITGITSEEGDIIINGIYSQPQLIKEFNNKFDTIAPKMFYYGESVAVKYEKSSTKNIKKFYLKDGVVNKDTKQQISELYADAMFLSAMDAAVQLHVKHTNYPVFLYLFEYKGSQTFCNLLLGSAVDSASTSVCHCDDLLYLFDVNMFSIKFQLEKIDQPMVELMTTMWTNFASNGSPTSKEDSLVWEPVSKEHQNYLSIKNADNLEMKTNMYPDRINFWRNLDLSSRTSNIRGTIKDEL